MKHWGFTYKNVFGTKCARMAVRMDAAWGFTFVTLRNCCFSAGGEKSEPPSRGTQVNFLATRKREHSRKPEELYNIVEACSYGPFLELFARHPRPNWDSWGNEMEVGPNGIPRGGC